MTRVPCGSGASSPSLGEPARALRRVLATAPGPASLVFIDVAGLGVVNRCLGPRAGDLLLGAFEARLRAAITGGELLWRHGGDEYVLLMPRRSARSARRRVARLQRRMRREVAAIAPGHVGALRFRAGGATAAPRTAAQDLYTAAARALGEAKRGDAPVVWS
jgi:diguanylate cyclase (GGDEF)-like protein